MHKHYVRKIIITSVILIINLFSSNVNAQYLDGPVSVDLGDTSTYNLIQVNYNIIDYGWYAHGGQIISQSISGESTSASVLWNGLGPHYIVADYMIDEGFGPSWFSEVLYVYVNVNSGVTNTQNYIHTITPTVEATDLSVLNNNQKQESITYFDGLGRPMQNIGIRAVEVYNPATNNFDLKDVITPVEYDVYGRQVKEYLPYADLSNNGAYRVNAINSLKLFYDDSKYDSDFPGMTVANINPYSEKQFEASPIDRVLKQAAPGNDWKLNGGHEIKLDYDTNVSSDHVKLFGVTWINNNKENPSLDNKGEYSANQLYKTITKDENWIASQPHLKNHTTEEFKDKEGRVILKRAYSDYKDTNGTLISSETIHDTYYVYDDYGNLTYVVPSKVYIEDGISQAELDDLCYQYKYDHRNRLIEKKLPGKGTFNNWEEIVYNKLDKPILTRDPNLKAQNKWLFTKYDAFGKIAYTGLINNNSTRITMQNAADGTSSQYVSRIPSATTIAGTTISYNNDAYPSVSITDELHTINYYDNYNFDLNGASTSGFYHVPISNAKGLTTGSMVRVLGTTNWTTNVNYYDDKDRLISNYSVNDYLGSTKKVNSKLDFLGKVLETTSINSKNSLTTTVIDKFYYDQTGRLTKQTQAINGTVIPEVIVENSYDDLGQVIKKKVGGKDNQSRLQIVDFSYNIRGWLKDINDINNLGNDLFAFKINYSDIIDNSKKLYNGNISQATWRTANNDPSLKNYIYSYDALNRLTHAESQNSGRYNESISYDKNGNIISLLRLGNTFLNTQNFGTIDNLIYSYDLGNKLTKVEDVSQNVQGFSNGTSGSNTDYTYDVNGNMITDVNKNITSISYNHLNLPTKIIINSGEINYIYDALGEKQRKIISTGTTIDYAQGFIYENNDLKFFSQPGGYISYNSGAFDYIYQYKDHLGNVRLSYDKNLNIVEENNYYPFGLKQNGYNNMPNYSYGSQHVEKYKYNGKELQDELKVNVYDYGWRQYMPDLGRWIQSDPLIKDLDFTFDSNNIDDDNDDEVANAIETTLGNGGGIFNPDNLSPYSYGYNNPIKFDDPDGRCPTCIIGAIIGAVTDYGIQVAANYLDPTVANKWTDNISYSSIAASAAEGALTQGGSAMSKVAIKTTVMITKNTVEVNSTKGIKIETNVRNIAKNTFVDAAAGGFAKKAGGLAKTNRLSNVANKVQLSSNTKAKNFVQKVTGLSSKTSSNISKKVDVKGISKQLSNGINNSTNKAVENSVNTATKNVVDKLKDKTNE